MARRGWAYVAVAVVLVAAVIGVNGMTCGGGGEVAQVGGGGSAARDPLVLAHARGSAVAKLDLPRGTLRLEGQVIDEDDRPVGGARVFLDSGARPATSEADGSFVYEQLPAGRYSAYADKDDLYSRRASVQLDPTSEPVTLRMFRGTMLAVHVLGEHGPLAGALVSIVTAGRTPVATGADGIARIHGLWPTWFELTVSAPGYADDSEYLVVLEDRGGTQDRTVTLRRGAPISGTVVGPDGSPVADATVEVDLLGADTTANATSDAQGAWKIDAIAAGRYHASAISAALGPTIGTPFEVDGTTPRRGIVVHVAPGGELAGTVVDTTGAPVAGIDIALQQSARVDQFHGTSDMHGEFAIRGLPAGSYIVLRYVGNSAPADRTVAIADGERAKIRIVIDDDHIAGTVVDQAGEPVAGAYVSADQGWTTDVSDARGHFALVLRHQDDHQVFVSRRYGDDTRRNPDATVHGSASDLKLVLAARTLLSGRVMFDGAPVASYGVQLTPKEWGSDPPIVVRAADGRFMRSDLHPGLWRVEVTADGMDVTTIEDVRLDAGKRTDLGDIALVRGRTLTGHVRDASGTPVSGARVKLGSNNDRLAPLQQRFGGNYVAITDAFGAYAFDSITRTQSYIEARHPQLGVSSSALVMPSDTSIDLVLVATGAIDGVVDNFRGDETFVAARAPGQTDHSAETNRVGEFQLEDLQPGVYTVRDSMPGMGQSIRPVTVTVAAGQRTLVHVQLQLISITVAATVSAAACTDVSFLTSDDGDTIGASECSAGVVTFPNVTPGAYLVCDRAQACVPIVVAEAPATQSFDARVPP